MSTLIVDTAAAADVQPTLPPENSKARDRLLEIVARCAIDRYAYFTPAARDLSARGNRLEIVLMGGQKSSFGYHFDLLTALLQANPGMRLRAVVDESPHSIALGSRVRAIGAELLTVKEFFARAGEFRECTLVDRYCTWLPGIKYKIPLREIGLTALRWEQFLNAPALTRDGHYRAHSDFMLANFDRFLALENVWADRKSQDVYYTALAAFISMDFTWFAYGCDDHAERYLPPDVGLSLGADDVFIDCGAHDGAESILFAQRVRNQFKRICAFEPDRINYAVTSRALNRYMADHKLDNILCYPLGVSDRNDYLAFCGSDVTVAITDRHVDAGPGLFVARLDDIIDEMTFLKLEIEGAELAALRGADGLIQAHKPVLAIAAYHKPADFLELTAHILSLDRAYRVSLRHHGLEPGLLCMYCR